MPSIYETNLEALRLRDPLLAQRLLGVQSNTKYEVFMQQDDFNIIDTDTNTPIFALNP